ncbi:hypothetical protein BCR43DRAFT_439453 [Syncephalastrum racemosum]|uniref:Calcium-activated potassium channel BK alpha subunit domain-containing protein n=1 Tax=Syncephalastrum racemosum TaxID=13706 RepID=A0A1X2HDB5_SYNRA|nr:hypothetical protein BCR43DRAFT_439453 [Syncephalastrum racemosum]
MADVLEHRVFSYAYALILLSIFAFSQWYTGIFQTGHPLSQFISFRFFIELLTTVPLLVSNFMKNGQFLYDKPIDLLKTKLIHLTSMLIVLLYNGMAAFQYCEATFANINYTIVDSLYVVMVTLSTVGYGVVVMLLIALSLCVLPSLIADVLATLRKRKDGGGHVAKGTIPFILIVGTFRPEQVEEILDGFLNREHAEDHLNVVFLDVDRPTEDLKLMERNSMWGHRVQFLHGSVLNDKTLRRARARYARAIITISDQNAVDPNAEDERNTVRLWSLYCYTVSHKVPIYTYNLSPTTAIYQKVAKEIICVREFKQYLLAMNCRCRGVSTLLTNLLHQRQPLNRYDEPWQAQYGKQGYHNQAYIVYKECQVILFAIKTYSQDCSGSPEILLNPSNDYVIRESDRCVYISESPREIKDIELLVRTCFVLRDLSAKHSEPPAVSTSSHISHRRYKLSRLPTPRHALLTGSRALIMRLGQTPPLPFNQDTSLPLSYILDEPPELSEVLIESAEHMRGHILVCLHHEVINIFKFIYNLRSPHLRPEHLQNIVLLCASPPKQKTFELINMFPKGDCRQPDDLLRAGVKTAKQVVVMSEMECLNQYERNSDSPAM